jgi:cytochrome c556
MDAMAQKWVRAAVLAGFGVAAVVIAGGGLVADDRKDDKLPEISEIMKKAHAKTDGYLAKIGKAAKGGMWDEAKKAAKDQALIAVALGKNEPPMGDKKSWEKLTKQYTETSKKIEAAAKKEDAKGVGENIGMIFKSCKGCHDAHK